MYFLTPGRLAMSVLRFKQHYFRNEEKRKKLCLTKSVTNQVGLLFGVRFGEADLLQPYWVHLFVCLGDMCTLKATGRDRIEVVEGVRERRGSVGMVTVKRTDDDRWSAGRGATRKESSRTSQVDGIAEDMAGRGSARMTSWTGTSGVKLWRRRKYSF